MTRNQGTTARIRPNQKFPTARRPLPSGSLHWCSSGFANTDLDLQLKKHGIHQLIVIGLRANTCIDSTVRHAAELGYEVTLVKDAIGGFSQDEMKATLELNALNYARAVLSTEELIAATQGIND